MKIDTEDICCPNKDRFNTEAGKGMNENKRY